MIKVTTVGLMLKDPPMSVVGDLARSAEAVGMSHFMATESSVVKEPATGRDPFLVASAALSTTTRLLAGTAVAGTVFHTSRHLALSAATLQEASEGRFVLGVGVSHKVFADYVGAPYPHSPVTHAQQYLDELRKFSHRGLAFGRGFPIWLGALGERMIETAAAHADGVLLNWVTQRETRYSLKRIAVGGSPRVAVVVRLGTTELLRTAAKTYNTMFPNYRRHFLRQGLSSLSDIVEQTCANVEDISGIRRLVTEYEAAGADHVLLYPADMEESAIHEFLTAFAVGGQLDEGDTS